MIICDWQIKNSSELLRIDLITVSWYPREDLQRTKGHTSYILIKMIEFAEEDELKLILINLESSWHFTTGIN